MSALDYSGRLIVHDREALLEADADTVALGDTFEVIRGNGPREGDSMGTATVVGIDDGGPVLDVHFGSEAAGASRGR